MKFDACFWQCSCCGFVFVVVFLVVFLSWCSCSGVFVKTTHERCGPFSLVVLSQRRGRVTTSSGPTLSETLSSKTLQVY